MQHYIIMQHLIHVNSELIFLHSNPQISIFISADTDQYEVI